MLVKCVSVCGYHVRPAVDEGRVLDYVDQEYIGLIVKVQWKTGKVHWYPAQNLQLVGFRSQTANNKHQRPSDLLTLEEDIFEPGDQVRISLRAPTQNVSNDQNIWQNVQLTEIGIISGIVSN